MAWMRQKSEPEQPPVSSPPQQAQKAAPAAQRESRMEKQIVNIGQSVEIKGELTGNEDLTIDGSVDGKIVVKDHSLTIGANGRITAEVHGKTVHVIGQVIGNITADDKVEIAPTGSVQGDIRAPRVSISDGARFKGSIDMGASAAGAGKPKQSSSSSSVGSSSGMSGASSEMPRSAVAAK